MTNESKTMTDLVERLETLQDHYPVSGQLRPENRRIFSEAAVALRAQARKIQVLRSNYETAQANWDLTLDRAETAEAQLSTVRRETLEEAAKVAEKHVGSAAKKRRDKGWKLSSFDPSTIEIIEHEERGEDFASEMIASRIRSLSSPVHEGEGGTTASKSRIQLCDDCPPLDYPTDKTRCRPCPRRDLAASSEQQCAGEEHSLIPGKTMNTNELRKCATCVYLAAESGPAEDIAKHLLWAADKIDRLSASPPPAKGVTEDEMVTLILKEWMAGGESYSVWEGGSRGFWAKLAARAVLRVLAGSSDGIDDTDKHTAVPCTAKTCGSIEDENAT